MDEQRKDEIDQYIGQLEDEGALFWAGMKGDEAVFSINLEKMKSVCPPLYESITKDMDEVLLKLYDEGLISIEYDENLTPTFKITEEGEEALGNFEDF